MNATRARRTAPPKVSLAREGCPPNPRRHVGDGPEAANDLGHGVVARARGMSPLGEEFR